MKILKAKGLHGKAVDIQTAIKLNFPDFKDAVISATAARKNADYIISRNAGDFVKSPIPAISPADFLKKHNEF